jgi:hypothetical protein
MDNIQTIGLLAGGSWASGINLYMTVAILGLSQRFGWIELPGSLDTLSHPLVITAAIVLTIIEFVADKVPYVDSAWDSIHTFIRPVGGALIGYLAASELAAPLQTVVTLAAGTVALDSHLTKATARAVINTSPEPVTNTTASVAEDASVIGAFYLIVTHPLIITIFVILFILFSIWFLKTMFRFVRTLFSPKNSAA